MNPTHTEARCHALDAVRAGALLAGIVLHATMAHLPGFGGLNWPIADSSTSVTLGYTFYVLHIFRMALFFIIAGFFARLLRERLGTWGLVKNRLRRIGLPLVASMVLIAPLVIVAIVLAVKIKGAPPAPPAAGAQPPVLGPAVPWMHLWFLYLLLVLVALALPVRALLARFDPSGRCREAAGRWAGRLVEWRVAPLLLTLPVAAALLTAQWWLVWQGIPTPAAGFVPNLPAVVTFGSAFALGWVVHREQRVLTTLASDWLLYLLAAIAASLAAALIAGDQLHFSLRPLAEGPRRVFAGLYALALWCWSFAALGAAVRFLDSPSRPLRYLADASYWMYLVHLPIIWLLQAWMLPWQAHWAVKFPLVLAVSMAVLLASYHWLVRRTFVGVFLNGRRHPRGDVARDVAIPAPNISPG